MHRKSYNTWKKDKGCKGGKCSCFPYFEKYGVENFKIVLIKSYEVCRAHVKDRRHLEAYETLWICKTKCVNENMPIHYLKREQGREKRKKYVKANKERCLKIDKKHYNANKDKILERQKKYYEENKDKLLEQHREYWGTYYEANKEKINEQKKEKYTCICGSLLSKSSKSHHEKSVKHQNFLSNH